jgi:hypothetical protein
MTPPVLTDYTFQYKDNGVLLNADSGSPLVDVSSVKGLDSAVPRVSQKDTEGTDGSTVEAEFESTRIVVIEGTLYTSAQTDLEPLIDSLKKNFAVSRDHLPFYFKPPGVEQRVLYAKCVSGFRSDWNAARRVATANFAVTLQSGDPIIYGSTLRSASASLDTGTVAGFSFAFSFSFSFGATVISTGILAATNMGNRDAPWRATFTGGVVNPTLMNETAGNRQVTLTITAAATDVLVIDSASRTATINGADCTGRITREQWFGILEGANQLRFLADSAGAGTAVLLEYYDAWR